MTFDLHNKSLSTMLLSTKCAWCSVRVDVFVGSGRLTGERSKPNQGWWMRPHAITQHRLIVTRTWEVGDMNYDLPRQVIPFLCEVVLEWFILPQFSWKLSWLWGLETWLIYSEYLVSVWKDRFCLCEVTNDDEVLLNHFQLFSPKPK